MGLAMDMKQNTLAPPPSERTHHPFLEGGTPGDEVLVYRPLQSHMVPIISPRVQWLLWGVLTVGVLAYGAWMLLRTFPELGRLDGEGWRTLAAAVWQKDSEKFRGWLLPMLYPLAVVVSAGVHWLSIHRLTLRIGPQGLRQEHRLPLGLHHLFGQNWQIAWGDVRRITVRRASLGGGAVPALAWVEIVVAVGYGYKRVLRPAFWFSPDDPPRPRLKPSGSPSPLTAPWGGAINDDHLAEAFAQLRLVRALEQHAPPACRALRWPGTAPVVGTDLNRQPEALALLLGTIVVFLTGWFLMLYAALLGRGDAWQTHRFAIADGQAKPMGADAAHVPPIELPGRQSRLAWIRAGSEADVRTVEGRWGVWIYNDEPLRALADQQGVR